MKHESSLGASKRAGNLARQAVERRCPSIAVRLRRRARFLAFRTLLRPPARFPSDPHLLISILQVSQVRRACRTMSATLDGAFPAMQDVVSTVETKADPEPSAIAPFSFPHMNGETAKADPNLNFLNVSHESAPGPSSLRASSAALSDAPSSPLSELPPPAAQRTSTRVVESSQSAGLHMSEIVASDGAFEAVHRVDVTEMTRESMSALIEEYMVTKGEPLVIGGFQKFPKWTPDLLTPERLVQELSADGEHNCQDSDAVALYHC